MPNLECYPNLYWGYQNWLELECRHAIAPRVMRAVLVDRGLASLLTSFFLRFDFFFFSFLFVTAILWICLVSVNGAEKNDTFILIWLADEAERIYLENQDYFFVSLFFFL